MEVTLVHVYVIADHVSDFIAATQQNHIAAVQEPGNLRFDVLQDEKDLTHFILYEAYADKSAAIAHKSTPHYLRWRDAVAEWMAQPRKGESFRGIYPE